MIEKTFVGKTGEDKAAAYLAKKGYRILARNFRNKLGEIDIIAYDGPVICFVEVRTRQNDLGHEAALTSVGFLKQRKLSRLAVSYLKENHLADQKARFDVIAVSLQENSVFLLKDAFPVAEKYN